MKVKPNDKSIFSALSSIFKFSLLLWGMVPRGEVGLIFASIGISLGAISQDLFSIIVAVVILTTFITPPVLAKLLRGRVA